MFFTKCSYKGQRTNGRMEGKGRFTFANGNQYIGHFRDGTFDGKGTVFFTQHNGGGKHKAAWKDGIAQEGTYFFADGLEYAPGDWGYSTPSDRRFWREHGSFIVPPVAGPIEDTIIPDYGDGVGQPRNDSDDEIDLEEPSVDIVKDGVPYQLTFVEVPGVIQTGVPFAVRVEVQDCLGLLVPGAEFPIHLGVGEGTTGYLSAQPQISARGRVAFTEGVYMGDGHCTLTASSGNLVMATTDPINVQPPSARHTMFGASALRLVGVPKIVATENEFSVTVHVVNGRGEIVPAADCVISIELLSGDGELKGTLSMKAEGGNVLFYDLSYHGSEIFTLRATAEGLRPSEVEEVVPVPEELVIPHKVTLVNVSATPPRCLPFTVTAVIQDETDRLAPTASHMVWLELVAGEGELKSTPLPADGGHAVFDDVVYTGSDPFSIQALAEELEASEPTAMLYPVAAATQLTIGSVSPSITSAGEPFEVIVHLQDPEGYLVDDANNLPVQVQLCTGEGRLFGSTATTSQEGRAVFQEVRYDGPDVFTLVAVDPTGKLHGSGPSPLCYSGPNPPAEVLRYDSVLDRIDQLQGPGGASPSPTPEEERLVATRLSILAMPDPPLGSPFCLLVEVQDDVGRTVTTATPMITLEVSKGTGQLEGDFPQRAVNGEVTFRTVSYTGDDPFCVRAVADGLRPGTTINPITPISSRLTTPQRSAGSARGEGAMTTTTTTTTNNNNTTTVTTTTTTQIETVEVHEQYETLTQTVERYEYYTEHEEAALRIQAQFRGHKVRKDLTE